MKIKIHNSKFVLIYLSIVLISFVFGFFINEDSLGGAYHDYKFHEKYFFKFADDFKSTINEYGNNNEVRNSPIFYIVISGLINLGFEIKFLQYLNILFVFLIIFFFLKSLEINYKNIELDTKIFFFCIILLSPTIRSLTFHPYPLLWALSFFIISIYFYLKFQKSQSESLKFKHSIFCILGLCISSYITPNFAVFILFYGIKFLGVFKISFRSIILFLFAFILSLPAIFFLIWKDFYLFYNTVYQISFFEKFNFFNKIVIISSFFFLFFLPFLKKINFKGKTPSVYSVKYILVFSIFLLTVYFFDFKPGAGGGFFYQASNLIFNNNFLLFLVFLFSIIVFDLFKIFNYDNCIIFFILILYNLQYTIYYKYFDPVLIFVLLFMCKFDKSKILSINHLGKRYFYFYIFFLLANIFKNDLKLILA